MWTWVKEGRTAEAQRAAGWSGLLGLPKVCRLSGDGRLIMQPASELTALRTAGRSVGAATLTPASEDPFSGFAGDCLEVEAAFSVDAPATCELLLRASPDLAECTRITYDSAAETLTVDGSRSSLDPDVDHPVVTAPLGPDSGGLIRFQVFLDRSVLEVFVGDRACVTQRLYPTRETSLGLSFAVREGAVRVRRLAAWRLAAVWPDAVPSGPSGG